MNRRLADWRSEGFLETELARLKADYERWRSSAKIS
jgi:hypothetical protein